MLQPTLSLSLTDRLPLLGRSLCPPCSPLSRHEGFCLERVFCRRAEAGSYVLLELLYGESHIASYTERPKRQKGNVMGVLKAAPLHTMGTPQ